MSSFQCTKYQIFNSSSNSDFFNRQNKWGWMRLKFALSCFWELVLPGLLSASLIPVWKRQENVVGLLGFSSTRARQNTQITSSLRWSLYVMHSQSSLEQFTKKKWNKKTPHVMNFSVVLTYGGSLFWLLTVLVVCLCAETRNFSSCIKEAALTVMHFLELWKLSFIVDISKYTNKGTLSFLYYLFLTSSEEMHRDISCSLLHLLVRFVAKICCINDTFYFSENKQNTVCWFQQVSCYRERNWYCKPWCNPGHWW